MLQSLIRWLIYSFLVVIIAWILPGISVENFFSAMLACIVIALINTCIKPFVQFISLPINFLTLGLFSFVINALLLMLAGFVTPGFEVDGFISALIGSLLLSLFSGLISKIE